MTSVSGSLPLLLGIAAACAAPPALATDDEVPETEFPEYLGLWEASDEDWLLMDTDAVVDNEERSEPAPEGEVSTETEDES